MGIYFGGAEYSKIYAGGAEASGILLRGADYAPATDQPGTLTATVSRSGQNRNFVFRITDPDGIRSITSATLRASSDGTTANVRGDFSRSDANTFAGTDTRRNARWNSGTLTVVYVDATSGESRTLTATFS